MSNKIRILVIDDDRGFAKTVCMELLARKHEPRFALNISDGWKKFKDWLPRVIVLDQRLPDGNGAELCRRITQWDSEVKVIMATAFGSVDSAVDALKAGAYDYLTKPLDFDKLYLTIENAVALFKHERREEALRFRLESQPPITALDGNSATVASIRGLIHLSAQNDANTLITGETGVGKGVVAQGIHRQRGSGGELISINCSAIPAGLIESELFGHEKGAFTDAIKTRKGVFELADGGTLVLEEIGEMPLSLQSKLLTVLDERRVRRVGGSAYHSFNLKLIATTNRNIEGMLEERKFRKDLFYRLSVVNIHIPPLREHPGDLPRLCVSILRQLVGDSAPTLTDEELERLQDYSWPGNTRELKNLLERALLLQQGGEFLPSKLLGGTIVASQDTAKAGGWQPAPLEELETQHIRRTLRHCDNNKTQAAYLLGISRSTLNRKLGLA